ncbi:MAG: type II toxin-antitoxin system Phd/YefM family antitoxin [Candidatus Eremiobacteraeota bacterium]|nr:type II toxin-antitoxin system Phd/YefM family antitoxin [Candidatus Eremiobacteraeota bacterium]MBV8434684.1 type II toxin-antitoxin system Phd/YefM family antitoxin [Candidatus Eremiobacteraeota bacterium]MBV8721877.1 type II toxin-antitoxin system Phd/YefM family antitoxin [Candidatus Eremiobacteraeota bacterium]
MTIKKKASARVSFLLLRSREIGAADFKARCLEVIDEVEKTNVEVVITRHRRPVARLVPIASASPQFCGSLRGTILSAGDLIAPIDEVWTGDEPNFT